MKKVIPLVATGFICLTGTFFAQPSHAQPRCFFTHANTVICQPQVYRNVYRDIATHQLGRNNEAVRYIGHPFSRYVAQPTLRAGSRFTGSVNSRMNRHLSNAGRDVRFGPGRSNDLVGRDGFVRRTLGF